MKCCMYESDTADVQLDPNLKGLSMEGKASSRKTKVGTGDGGGPESGDLPWMLRLCVDGDGRMGQNERLVNFCVGVQPWSS